MKVCPGWNYAKVNVFALMSLQMMSTMSIENSVQFLFCPEQLSNHSLTFTQSLFPLKTYGKLMKYLHRFDQICPHAKEQQMWRNLLIYLRKFHWRQQAFLQMLLFLKIIQPKKQCNILEICCIGCNHAITPNLS